MAPGVYFRMHLVGFFEGIESERGLEWRFADSLSLRQFLGLPLTQRVPDHSTLSRTRQRLPLAVHQAVFALILGIVEAKGLLKGRVVGVDSTYLRADASMKAIVRRDTRESYAEFVLRLATEAGVSTPTAEEARRLDRKRTGKKTSNREWVSRTDPEARIAKLKDGRTRLAYKPEHVMDLETGAIVAAAVHPADVADPASVEASLTEAEANLQAARGGAPEAVQPAEAPAPTEEGDIAAKRLPTSPEGRRRQRLPQGHPAPALEDPAVPHLHPGAPPGGPPPVDRQGGHCHGRRLPSEPSPRIAAPRQTLSPVAGRAGGTQLRPRLRDGWGAPDPVARPGECGEALSAASRRGESRPRDADLVRPGHPARVGGPRAGDAADVLGFHARVVASRVGPSPVVGHFLACAGALLAAARRSDPLVGQIAGQAINQRAVRRNRLTPTGASTHTEVAAGAMAC